MANKYKKCRCMRCNNIYNSKANMPKCIKGSLDGCGSKRLVILEEYNDIRAEPEQVEEIKQEEGFWS